MNEFFTLLNYMKIECALLMPDNGKCKPEHLSHFALPSHYSYFIPLGTLKSGDYILIIKVKENIRFRAEVISNQLDPSLDQLVPSSTKEHNIHFTIDETLDYFLRIRSRGPLYISTLEIKKSF